MRFALALIAAFEGASSPPARIGDRAPVLALDTLEGHVLRDPSLTGQITIVDFFATWCGPCHRALDDLADVEGQLSSPPRLVVISVGEDAMVVKRYIEQHPLPTGAELALDPTSTVARAWGQDRFPTTFIVDGDGVIRHINRGWGRGYAERMRRWLRSMTSPAPVP